MKGIFSFYAVIVFLVVSLVLFAMSGPKAQAKSQVPATVQWLTDRALCEVGVFKVRGKTCVVCQARFLSMQCF